MPNLNLGQTAWTNMFREFVQYIRLYRLTRDMSRRFLRGRIRVFETMDSSNFLSLWTIVGAQRGINCSEDGRLYVKLTDETPGAGQARTQLYMDSAKTQLVAQGDAADGATATLTAQNNSGLSGTVKLSTITASPTNIVLLLDIDETVKATRAFDLTTVGGIASFKAILSKIEGIGSSLEDLRSGMKGEIEQNYVAVKMAEVLKSSASNALSISEAADSNGDIQVTTTGIIADLIDDMADDSTPQSVLQNTVSNGSPSYDADNVGSGTLNVLANRQQQLNGLLTLTCLTGKQNTLSETFTAVIKTTDGPVLKSRNNLTIKKEWESSVIGCRLRLDRSITDDEPGAGTQLATWVISGETTGNTDVGDLYAKVMALSPTVAGNNRRVILYKDSARQQIVAQGDRLNDGTVTLVAQNNSGLSGSVVLTYASDKNDIIVHLRAFDVGDVIELQLTNDNAGKIASLFSEIWGVAPPTSGAPTLPDSILLEGLDHVLAIS